MSDLSSSHDAQLASLLAELTDRAQAGEQVDVEQVCGEHPTLACREKGVGFMDGTHFPHLPRTQKIRTGMLEMAGRPWSVASAFQFNLRNLDNIRLVPALEPYGAIGDAGWYNMQAAVEYLPDDVELLSSDAGLQRKLVNNAVISGSGVMHFSEVRPS